MAYYYQIPESKIPEGVRWDVPRSNQGQIVTVSYADWPSERTEAGPGSAYQRVFDASDRSVAYYRLGGAR